MQCLNLLFCSAATDAKLREQGVLRDPPVLAPADQAKRAAAIENIESGAFVQQHFSSHPSQVVEA